MNPRLPFLLLLATLIAQGCKQKQETLFRLVDPEDSGITFSNFITESDSLNILTQEYIYNGGGVGVADFNNDGLSDVYLTGNLVPNKLYLNRGNLQFEDITSTAMQEPAGRWKSAVAIADVNGDGWKDIYVCATIQADSSLRQNMLYIHRGLNKDGIPTFEDQASAYGVNDHGHSSGAAFLDYDNDNDLDLFVITNTIVKGIPTSYRPKINDGTMNADVLYRNNGDGTFTNVSREAGILHEGYGLGVAVADINQDGWQDIYVSNDYITNDLLYINNGDGTFREDIEKCIKHQAQFSMGNDIADFNNDGLPDIATLDMLPEGNLRRKTVINGTTYTSYINNDKYKYGHQYIRNMLQLNNGDGTFSEIGQLAGIHQTEWSWAPLFADVDNDGLKDLLITNGFPRDVTDKDFGNFRDETRNLASVAYQIDSIPVVKVANYAFRNNGDLTFSNMTREWGMDQPSFSNGASFADLDNDGDLDYIINNINDNAFVYENTLYKDDKAHDSHFVRIRLSRKDGNTAGLGAKVMLKDSGQIQYHDHSVYRGYISSVEEIIHFGTGTRQAVDTVVITWPDGKTTVLTNLPTDRVVEAFYESAQAPGARKNLASDALFKEVAGGINHVHQEHDAIDFNLQRTLPHKLSQSGPGLAVGDVNGDGLEDFYVGGSSGFNGAVFIQGRGGKFQKKEIIKPSPAKQEDQGSLFFDADGDNDLDLYVVSGTFEYGLQTKWHEDRLYINNGKGDFTYNAGALPETNSSGSCVRASDIDNDGDLDLFVGGRVVPAQYPYAPESYVLINENGKFVNKTESICAELKTAGMITDALWSDVNNDFKPDLILAGEFMPVMIFRNDGGVLTRMKETGLEQFSGWWNSLAGADFDSDGDVDFVAGNLGLNNYYKASSETPLRVYAKDFDGNNSVDAILSCYLLSEDGVLKEYPVHFWDELNSQSPRFRKMFRYYRQYGRTTMSQLLPETDLQDATVLAVQHTATSFIKNEGNGKFSLKPLPQKAQVAPVNGIVATDINGDGHADLLMVGNDYGNEIFTGRHDAFTGLALVNDGSGVFSTLSAMASGFKVDHDAKALARLMRPDGEIIIATQNRDSLKIFAGNGKSPFVFSPAATDVSALMKFANGSEQKVEFYFGSGYLSQSTRSVIIPANVSSLIVYDSQGKSRVVDPRALAKSSRE